MDFLTDLESCIPSLRRYARALVRDGDRADDLVQDCLERALSRRHLWRDGPTLRPWLFRIMHNLHANHIRALRARPVHQPLDAPAQLPEVGESQSARLLVAETARALDQLAEEQRRVVLLVALEGLSYQEVAEVLDVPVGTVMSRLSRARERLRQLTGNEAGATLRRIK